jgi:hypothetical protein
MSSDRAVMKGEVGMRGALVVEMYLDAGETGKQNKRRVQGWLFASDEQGGVETGPFPSIR